SLISACKMKSVIFFYATVKTITYLDVGLKRLDLSNNYIRRLHALNLPYLEHLDVSSNQLDLISEGFFQNLSQLEEVNLSRNTLNNNLHNNGRAFRSINKLKILDISLNGLSGEAVKLYLQNKFALDQLMLSGNALRWLSSSMFGDCINLRTICIDNNLISVIQQGVFESMKQLETLHLAQNNLANICDFKLYNLKYLNLSRNSIEYFVTRQDDFPYRLEILDLSFNKLLYLPIVPKLNRLRYLHLQHNNIGFFISEAELVSENNALYNKVLHGNRIIENKNYLHYNWRRMPLVYIDLSNNNFQTFPLETLGLLSSLEIQAFYPSLKYLNLQSNGLAHVSTLFLETLVQIETLNLQDNSVQPCPFEVNLSLQQKNSQQQMSSCMSFRSLRTLKHLNLRENNIKIFYNSTFERNPIVSLNLGSNPLMVIQSGALEALRKTLRSLTLSELNISEVVLPCMPALTQLNISYNIFDLIPSDIACSPLTEIDIRNNMLQSLSPSFPNALTEHVIKMYISGNPFNCCEITWLTLFNKSKVTVPDLQNVKCSVGNVKIKMEEFVKNLTNDCGDLKNTSQDHSRPISQLLIVIVFLLIFFIAIFIFCKRVLLLAHIV
uniref:Toll-like receptor 3 n=1 Tax=Neogobius melanostomus TaxID=47308 RepID=A0A8C6WN81_9GOBI